jgi:hypothetical protein
MEDKNKTSDYSQGKIYKIVCNKTGLVYIGSTCKTLDERLKQHEYDAKRYLDKKSNKFVSSIYIIISNDYKMELIENYSCNHKKELETKEYYYITNLEGCVNMHGYLSGSYIQKHCLTYSYHKNQHMHKQVEMIRDKLGNENFIKILFRYGIEEYKNNKLK